MLILTLETTIITAKFVTHMCSLVQSTVANATGVHLGLIIIAAT